MGIRSGKYYECGCCGSYHHEKDNWQDCRDDSTRFGFDDLVDENGNDLPDIEIINLEEQMREED